MHQRYHPQLYLQSNRLLDEQQTSSTAQDRTVRVCISLLYDHTYIRPTLYTFYTLYTPRFRPLYGDKSATIQLAIWLFSRQMLHLKAVRRRAVDFNCCKDISLQVLSACTHRTFTFLFCLHASSVSNSLKRNLCPRPVYTLSPIISVPHYSFHPHLWIARISAALYFPIERDSRTASMSG